MDEVPVYDEGIDQFADPSAPALHELVEPDIKCVGEVVSSALDAKETASKTEIAVLHKANFGDLPEELWSTRAEQEGRWMAPQPDDTVHDLDSQMLPHPDRSLIIGTNGFFSFALQCADDETVKLDPEIMGEKRKTKKEIVETRQKLKDANKDSKTETLMTYFDEYAKKNVLFAYKRALSQWEREAFYLTAKYDMANVHLCGDAKILMQRLMDMAKVDSTLRSPISKLGERMSDLIRKLPERFPAGARRPVPKQADRPGGEFAAVQFMTVDFHPTTGDDATVAIEATDANTVFRLLLCRTPVVLQSKSAKKKKPHWVDVDLIINTESKTVPACAFNDTHFAILYLPKTKVANGVIFVDLYVLPTSESTSKNGGKLKLTRVDRFCFRFPPQFSAEGMINMNLSPRGIISISYANGVLVFDAFRLVDQIHVILLQAKEKRHRRLVTTSAVFHPPAFPRPVQPEAPAAEGVNTKEDHEHARNIWCGTVILGTSKGESYGVNWRTGHVHFTEASPGVEPIFAVHYSNGKTFMQTVMSICGNITNLSTIKQMTVLPIDRPMAMDTCGSLIFIVSKYGIINIMSSVARQVARQFPPPLTSANTPLLQPAYKGIRAFPDHVVCVYPSGLVRNLVLAKMDPKKK